MITPLDDPRVEIARQTIGAVRIVADPGLPPHLLRLLDARGKTYVAKRHTQRDRYTREVHAYRTWGHHLRGYVPELVGWQDSTHTMLLTGLPGDSGDRVPLGSAEEEQAHHVAGFVLGALHRTTALGPTGAIGAELAQRVRDWITRADRADLISSTERGCLLRYADALANTIVAGAVCHLDYQPRNWLVREEVFGVCDFEHMRRDARIRDFTRLEFRHWQARPRLRDAFFDGYGARLTGTEQQLLESFGAIEAITAIVRGHEQGDVTLSAHGRTVLARLP
ncbi:aminoglycoside phosphotransferase family protein [Streptomyces sp. NPDC058256]|uniref:aminoglycoside phosphotransferase family protein n=1 Tax=Streptomyces sp. NPDC058256 TaxID=3346408 RepID=UPI0036EFD725